MVLLLDEGTSLNLISQRSVGVVYLVTGESRKESADYPHTGFCLKAVAVMIVHGIQDSGLYLMNLTVLQFLDSAFTFQTIACFKMILLPQDRLKSRLKD
jgi:hypothetical protein